MHVVLSFGRSLLPMHTCIKLVGIIHHTLLLLHAKPSSPSFPFCDNRHLSYSFLDRRPYSSKLSICQHHSHTISYYSNFQLPLSRSFATFIISSLHSSLKRESYYSTSSSTELCFPRFRFIASENFISAVYLHTLNVLQQSHMPHTHMQTRTKTVDHIGICFPSFRFHHLFRSFFHSLFRLHACINIFSHFFNIFSSSCFIPH